MQAPRSARGPRASLSRRHFLGQGAALTFGGALIGCRGLGDQPPPLAPAPVPPLAPARDATPLLPDVAASRAPRPDQLPGGQWPAPDLSGARVMRFIAGLRPYRRGSIRVEIERRGGLFIVHNYGHGGAGITLSPGTSMEAIELLSSVQPAARAIAVLGAGVNGLTVATQLVAAGFSVKVYAREFQPHTTSNVAGGQFAPSLVAHGQSPEETAMYQRAIRRSYAHYSALVGRGYGVSARINYTVGGAGAGLRQLPTEGVPAVRSYERLPICGVRSSGRGYETFLIEPSIYLARLHRDLVAAGVIFEQHEFRSLDELQTLGCDAVINCLGLGAGSLFADERVLPVRGQLVLVEPQNLPFLLSHRGYLFPRADAIVLGGTAERGVWEAVAQPQRCEALLDLHRGFFHASTSQPPL